MFEFEKVPTRDVFRQPNLEAERGEFVRVGCKFGIDDSVLMYQAEQQGSMIKLTNDIWSQLDNTDSYRITVDDHEAAASFATMNQRDYHKVAEQMYVEAVDAPIIMKYGVMYHLVSGNTRLMAARAYGVTPNVWMFEVEDHAA